MKRLPNIHPGEVLLHEFLDPMGISQNALARAAGVPPRRINEIVAAEGGSAKCLRVSVEGGGCSGFQYKFELADLEMPDDVTHLPVPSGGRGLPHPRHRRQGEQLVRLFADRSQQVVLAREVEEVPFTHRAPSRPCPPVRSLGSAAAGVCRGGRDG